MGDGLTAGLPQASRGARVLTGDHEGTVWAGRAPFRPLAEVVRAEMRQGACDRLPHGLPLLASWSRASGETWARV